MDALTLRYFREKLTAAKERAAATVAAANNFRMAYGFNAVMLPSGKVIPVALRTTSRRAMMNAA